MYQNLVSDEWPLFRLLTLQASPSRDDPIQCAINALPLHTDVPYEALSYCWGDVKDTTTIMCNGEAVSVTVNLHAALQQLRRPDRPRFIWVDFLCINQADVVERASQVTFMRYIYSQATRVVVWLGLEEEVRGKDGKSEKGDTIEQCFNFCEQSTDKWLRQTRESNQKKRDKAWKEITSDWAKTSLERSAARLESSETWCDPNRHSKKKHRTLRERFDGPVLAMYVFGRLMERSWWSRAWVVQEISVARDAIVCCGSSWIEWDALSMAIVLANYGVVEDSAIWAINESRAVSVIRFMANLHRESEPLDLLDTLSEFRDTYATDPRDKVYAFLGLVKPYSGKAEEKPEPAVQSDYVVDVATCYRQTALTCLAQRGNLDCLFVPRIPSSVASQSKLDHVSGVPSWVADWSFFDPQSCEIPIGLGFAGRTDKYAACGSDVHYTALPVDDAGECLCLSGYVLDTLDQISPAAMPIGMDQGIPYDIHYTQGKRNTLKMFGAIFGEYVAVLEQWDKFLADIGGISSRTDRRSLLADLLHGGKDADDYEKDDDENAVTRIQVLMWMQDRAAELNRLGLERWTATTCNSFMGFVDLADRFRHLPTVGAHRRLAATANRRDFALVPQDARMGDRVVLCEGGKIPLILRSTNEGDEKQGVWKLVGIAYIPNIMQGEAWEKERCGSMLLQ